MRCIGISRNSASGCYSKTFRLHPAEGRAGPARSLAAGLGIPLSAAMAQLRTVEDNLGAALGLREGRYLKALGSVCSGDAAHLSVLDAALRQACDRVRFVPRSCA